jgi:hypothetical protein
MRSLLSLTIAALLAGTAQAGTPAAAPAARPAAAAASAPRAAPTDREAIRAEIHRLAERIHELSRQLGEDERIVMREHRGGPGMAPPAHPGMPMDSMAPHAQSIGIGVVLAPNTAAAGVRLAAVTPGNPAAQAGLRSGDILLSVDGRKIAGKGEEAVESARSLLHGLTRGQKVRLGYARAGKTAEATVVAGDIRRMVMFGGVPGQDMDFEGLEGRELRGLRTLDPQIEGELRRVLPMARCEPGQQQCDAPALFEAFRWQGLNLASLDGDLGHYFGTEHGVLVLSGGPGLEGLHAGDVIQKVGGTAVDSPREVMRALRGKPVGSALALSVLRDRKAVAVSVKVPEARPLPFLAPPTPPTPPTPPAMPAPPPPPPGMVPRTPHAAPPAMPAPPPPPPGMAPRTPRAAPPAPPAPPVEGAPPAPPMPPPPQAADFAPEAGEAFTIVDATEL